jgi:predicted DNA-binding transcriptional regulator AlpA
MRVIIPDGGEPSPLNSRMIFKTELLRLVGCSYATVWRWMREHKFPMSFDVGGKTAWREDEINAWFASRPRSTLKKREA